MERILRSVIQVNDIPDSEDAYQNWVRLKEHSLEFNNEEDKKISVYLDRFYSQMSAPPDLDIIREYFEKQDDIDVVNRLEEIKKSQFYIKTNFLAIIRSEQESQLTKNFIILCRDSASIAEHGRNLEKPVDGKKVIRGVHDAVGYVYSKLSDFTKVESGEKLEGVIAEDAEDVLGDYETATKTNSYANRNIFGLEPVDSACEGHRSGEFWVHCGYPGELKCITGDSTIYDHNLKRRITVEESYELSKTNRSMLPVVTALYREGARLKLVHARASHLVQNGVVPVFEVTLSSGRSGKYSDNHKVLTPEGWTEVYDLRKGMLVAVPRRIKIKSPDMSYSYGDIKTACHLIGDGYSKCFDDVIDDSKYNIFNYIIKYKRIPNEFFFLPDAQVVQVLKTLWLINRPNHVNTTLHKNEVFDKDIKYHSSSKELCLDIQSLLLRLGIDSIVAKYDKFSDPIWVLRINGTISKRIFIDKIKIKDKEKIFDRIKSTLKNADDEIYPSHFIPNGVDCMFKNKRLRSSTVYKAHKTIQGSTFREFIRVVPYLKKFFNSDLRWERVESIVSCGNQMTYDLSVPRHHTFVSNDIVTHNTTLALNYAYNNAYKFGKNIFYAILEMPYKQLRRMLYVLHSSNGKFVTEWHHEDVKNGVEYPYVGIDYRKVRDGRLSKLEYDRFVKVAQDFKATCKGKLYLWRPETAGVTVSEIQRRAEMFHNKYGCNGIIVDHMGLCRPDASVRTNDYVTQINSVVSQTRWVSLNFARGKTVPLLALFHMNRQGKIRADKNAGKYDMASISYANQIEKDADVITYTYLNDELRKKGQFYMGNLKNRDNMIFEQMIGRVFWNTKRLRAIETGLLDVETDKIKTALNGPDFLTTQDMLT